MAQEQDVFISGISGSIAQWSTEATAGRISTTLSQIAGQNVQLINLLNHVAAGTKMSTKEMNEMGNEVRSSNKAAKSGQKAERIEAAKQGQFWKGLMSKVGMGDNRIVEQLIKNQQSTRNASKKIEELVKSGVNRDVATSFVRKEDEDGNLLPDSVNRKNFTKAAGAVMAFLATIEDATKAGYLERANMAAELRQSGLTASLDKTNQGFLQLSRMISETGFEFGHAAEFTKEFSRTVGIKGVQSTLKFANSMADAESETGMMQKFALSFGQVVNMSGQYLDGLRISGQLQGRSDQQLRKGMDSFMSNVEATSNVLKISMEEAAKMMADSMTDVDQGRFLTLDPKMQESILSGLQFAGAGEGPIMDLLAARLGAGSEQAFMMTSEFQEYSGSMLGQELLKYVNQVAPTLGNQGDKAFQTQLANTLPQMVDGLIEMFSQSGNRALIMSNDQEASRLAQLSKMKQTMADANKGISGGGREDKAAMLYTEQQREAVVQAERSMTRLMPAFTKNIEDLTTVNREFANQAAMSLKFNQSLISSLTNTIVAADIAFKSAAIGFFEMQGESWTDFFKQFFAGEDIKNPLFDGTGTSFKSITSQNSLANPTKSIDQLTSDFGVMNLEEAKIQLEKLKKEQGNNTEFFEAIAGNTSMLPIVLPALMTLLTIPGGDKIIGLNQGVRDAGVNAESQARVIAALEAFIKTLENQ
jgi:hypothetical protein